MSGPIVYISEKKSAPAGKKKSPQLKIKVQDRKSTLYILCESATTHGGRRARLTRGALISAPARLYADRQGGPCIAPGQEGPCPCSIADISVSTVWQRETCVTRESAYAYGRKIETGTVSSANTIIGVFCIVACCPSMSLLQVCASQIIDLLLACSARATGGETSETRVMPAAANWARTALLNTVMLICLVRGGDAAAITKHLVRSSPMVNVAGIGEACIDYTLLYRNGGMSTTLVCSQ